MGAGAGLAQFEDRAARDHFAAMAHEGFEDLLEVQQLRATVDQCHHVDAEHRFHRRLRVEVVQHDLGGFAALDLDVDAHAVLVGLVAQLADAFELLFLHQLGDLLDQPRLVDLVRDLGDDDRLAAVVRDLDLGLGAHAHAAAAGAIGHVDAADAVDDAGRGEIRARDVLHQAIDVDLRLVEQRDRRVDHFREVVRRDVRRHADRDAGRTIDQQVREARRHHRRLLLLLVVVRLEVDGVLVDVGHQLVGEPGHARLGVTHRRGVVAVDRTEVALPVHQQVAQRERLRHAHQGVVHRLVAVRVVLTDHVTDDARRLVVRLVAVRAQFVHREQHAAVHRLEAVPHVRERAPHDHAHGVVEVAAAHLVFEIDGDDFLGGLGHSDVFGWRAARRPGTPPKDACGSSRGKRKRRRDRAFTGGARSASRESGIVSRNAVGRLIGDAFFPRGNRHLRVPAAVFEAASISRRRRSASTPGSGARSRRARSRSRR